MSNQPKVNVTEAIRELAHRQDRPREPLTADQLAGLLSEDLAESTRYAIEDCLAEDPEAAQWVEDLRVFSDQVREGEDLGLDDTEIDSQWLQLEAAISRPATRVPPSSPRPRRWLYSSALAASLLAAFGLAAWNQKLLGTLTDWDRPTPNVQVISLLPDAPTRSTQIREPTSHRGARTLLLLNYSGRLAFDRFRIAIRSPGRSEWVTVDELAPHSESRVFTLELPNRFLPPGESRLTLLGWAGSDWTPIAHYDLRVEPPEAP